MNPDLDTLATTVYVTVDDLLIQHPEWVPQRPAVGIAPKLSDAELVTLAVIQSLLRYTSEARFLRYAHAHLKPWFPYLPTRSAYNRRLRRLGLTMQHIIAWLARDCPSWHDDLWLVDSTPVECGRSRTTQQRSDPGGMGRIRLLRLPLPLLLGAALPPGGHPIGTADSLRAGAGQSEQTRHRHRNDRPRPPSPSGPNSHGGQRIPKRQLRGRPQRGPHDPHPPRHKNRSAQKRPAVPPTLPPHHRIDLPNLQGPTRSRTSRRTHQSECCDTCPPTDTRPHHRHLAQRNHPTTRPSTLPHRI